MNSAGSRFPVNKKTHVFYQLCGLVAGISPRPIREGNFGVRELNHFLGWPGAGFFLCTVASFLFLLMVHLSEGTGKVQIYEHSRELAKKLFFSGIFQLFFVAFCCDVSR